jgi:dihydroorotate dehydrogenase
LGGTTTLKLFTLFYKTDKQIINKTNLTQEEVQEFLNNLKKENNSELRVTQIKNKFENEIER